MTDLRPTGSNSFSDLPALSRLGLGAWAFGRTGWGAQSDHDSRLAILRAVELGVTWIDTAAVYGNGHSEELVGEVLSDLPDRDRPLVFTKGGIRVDSASGLTFRDLRPASLRQECEMSLRRLRLEQIDLYQVHWPTEDHEVVEQAWDTLGDLSREGKIRWAGVSNFDTTLLERCSRIRAIDCVQLPLSLLDRRAAESVMPWADSHGTPAVAYSPLASGLLSGSFSQERLEALPDDDWRRRRDPFQSPQVEYALELVDLLRPTAIRLGLSLAELAIAWSLHWQPIVGAIVGARSPEQVDGWIGAADQTLDEDVIREIEVALAETSAGKGPIHPGRSP